MISALWHSDDFLITQNAIRFAYLSFQLLSQFFIFYFGTLLRVRISLISKKKHTVSSFCKHVFEVHSPLLFISYHHFHLPLLTDHTTLFFSSCSPSFARRLSINISKSFFSFPFNFVAVTTLRPTLLPLAEPLPDAHRATQEQQQLCCLKHSITHSGVARSYTLTHSYTVMLWFWSFQEMHLGKEEF